MALLQDQSTNIIQAMPLVEGLIGLTTGTIGNVSIVLCTADGGFTLTFPSGATASITMVTDAVRSVPRGSTVAITSGTFDFA